MNNTLELQIKTAADGAIQSVKVLNQNIKAINSTLNNTSSRIKTAFSFGTAFASMKKIGKSLMSMISGAIDRTEELNLFNVVFKNIEKNGKQTFSELGREATKFQNTMNEKFGTNMTESLRYQALYQSMAENAGIDTKYAAIISENMTKFAYDLASLYNTTEKNASEALKSGILAGQIKPMRSYGVDLTEKSMGSMLLALGISDRSVSQLSQAEKEILRYITTLNQAKIAMGDYADTIESPANQMKVFNNTIAECKVAISSLFIGLFSRVLPIVNGLLMVIKALATSIASLFGIEIRDYNSGISVLGEDFGDVAEGAGKAAEKVKELKRQTLGFDQINNLTTNNNNGSGSGSGTGISGGIDKRLLEAIKGYDNGMESVRMKATQIRDQIMRWLGFVSETNEETGKLEWKFDHITGGTVLGSLAVGGTIFAGLKGILGIFEKITGFNLFSSIGSLGTKISETIAIVKGGAGTLSEAISLNFPKIGKIITKLGLISPKVLLIGGALSAIIVLAKRLYQINDEFRDKVNKFGDLLKNDVLPTTTNLLKNIALPFLKEIWDILKKIWNDIIVPLVDLLASILKPVLDLIIDALSMLWTKIIKPMTPILEWIVNSALGLITDLLSGIATVIGWIIDGLDWLWKKIFEPLVESVIKGIEKKIKPAIESISLVINTVKNAIQKVVDWWNNLSFNKKKIEVNYSVGGGGSGSFGGGGGYVPRAKGGSFYNGSWHGIQQYANGGMPSHGTLFAAGEAGAEVVGHINGRTEVLNQSQLASVMYSAVSSAMANQGASRVELYAHTDEGVIIDRINQKTNQTGVCPINIPY